MEKELKQGHVLIKTKGHCFFCLDRVSPKFNATKSVHFADSDLDLDSDSESDIFEPVLASYSTYSLRYLCHYLRLNWDANLVDPVDGDCKASTDQPGRRPKWKVILCGECASLNGRFATLYKQLEKIQMEVISCLSDITGKMTKLDVEGVKSWNGDGLLSAEEKEIVEGIRKKAMHSCNLKLRGNLPRVSVKRLKLERVEPEVTSCKPKRTGPSVIVRFPELNGQSLLENDKSQARAVSTTPCQPEIETGVNRGEPTQRSLKLTPEVGGDTELATASSTITREGHHEQTANKEPTDEGPKPKEGSPHLELQTSYIVNSEAGKYLCKICGKMYARKGNAVHHFDTSHLGIRLKCKVCGNQYRSKQALMNHHATAHSDTEFMRERGQKQFRRKPRLKKQHQNTDCPGKWQKIYTEGKVEVYLDLNVTENGDGGEEVQLPSPEADLHEGTDPLAENQMRTMIPLWQRQSTFDEDNVFSVAPEKTDTFSNAPMQTWGSSVPVAVPRITGVWSSDSDGLENLNNWADPASGSMLLPLTSAQCQSHISPEVFSTAPLENSLDSVDYGSKIMSAFMCQE